MATRRAPRKRTAGSASGGGRRWFSWLAGIFSSREIENRVDENFPSWEEFSAEKIQAAEEQREEKAFDLPPHRIYIRSPLQGNFLYLVAAVGAITLGYALPEQAPFLIYGAIVTVALLALFVVFRDAIFFHLEAMRLRADAAMINKHTKGPGQEKEKERFAFLKALVGGKKAVFRSKLLQIHYQNVLRTFEQGNRRAWVNQDASIADIETLLSQRGMKLVWTLMEVLPQMGLIGTLMGLTTMFLAFNIAAELPEVAIIAGFGTALGTTILANLFVLLLRPLYMQNERAMNETLSTLQMLMAVFILPTQQTVFDRSHAVFARQMAMPASSLPANFNEGRLSNAMEDLATALGGFTTAQQDLNSGAMARETAQVAGEVRAILRSLTEAVQPRQIAVHDEATAQLTEAMRGLTRSLNRMELDAGQGGAPHSERIEHDLTQLRLLTHDTLLLLEQIAGQMGRVTQHKPALLSEQGGIRSSVFPDSAPGGEDTPDTDAAPGEERGAEPSDEAKAPGGPRIRLFDERR
ncbi:MAG: MotA/TolQ/ExbB proton channel family protein [Candidatus Lambdaproteobacteria bacterium]|nr:MotA/TolQ/ExbB proton channel family protein [Candidatus Lambdaproteobacteria bacterium]